MHTIKHTPPYIKQLMYSSFLDQIKLFCGIGITRWKVTNNLGTNVRNKGEMYEDSISFDLLSV